MNESSITFFVNKTTKLQKVYP